MPERDLRGGSLLRLRKGHLRQRPVPNPLASLPKPAPELRDHLRQLPRLDAAGKGAPGDLERLSDDQAPLRWSLPWDCGRAGGGGLSHAPATKKGKYCTLRT